MTRPVRRPLKDRLGMRWFNFSANLWTRWWHWAPRRKLVRATTCRLFGHKLEDPSYGQYPDQCARCHYCPELEDPLT